MNLRRPALLAATAFVACASCWPALAQDTAEAPVAEVGDAFVLSALGHRLTMPLPDWLDATSVAAGTRIAAVDNSFSGDESMALFEAFPKGEDQQSWTILYGARLALNANKALVEYRNATMTGYALTCKPEATGFFQFGADTSEDLATLGFVCGAFVDSLAGSAGRGEVMIMQFEKSATGVAMVYQEWRGAAFDPQKPATWPVSTKVVEARAAQLKAEVKLDTAD